MEDLRSLASTDDFMSPIQCFKNPVVSFKEKVSPVFFLCFFPPEMKEVGLELKARGDKALIKERKKEKEMIR